jgi:hypothetical protein
MILKRLIVANTNYSWNQLESHAHTNSHSKSKKGDKHKKTKKKSHKKKKQHKEESLVASSDEGDIAKKEA